MAYTLINTLKNKSNICMKIPNDEAFRASFKFQMRR